MGYIVMDKKVVGQYSETENAYNVSIHGKSIVISKVPGDGSLFTLKQLSPEERILVIETIAKDHGMTREEFIKSLIATEISDDNGSIEATSYYGDVEMKIIVKKIPIADAVDVAIIEMPKNITILQFSMFEKFKDRMADLVLKPSDEEIKKFATEYTKDYVFLTLDEVLF